MISDHCECKETIPFRRWIDDVWTILSWLWKHVKEHDKVKKKSHTNNTEQLKTDPQRKLKY